MKLKISAGIRMMPLLCFLGFSAFAQPLPTDPGQASPVASPAGEVAIPVNLSPAAAEVVRLGESGVGEDVITAYVQGSQSTYNLSADDILYLKDVGLSSQVVTAMIAHDSSLRNQPQQQNTYDQKLYAPANPAVSQPPIQQPPLVPTQAPAPAPPVEVAQPAYVSNAPAEVNYFYNDLSPYGTWVELDGYGWCWQPRTVVVNRQWSPYCDAGHWVYTDAGWYWQSDYSWGWAPFHYGRWHRHERCGWVWLPDTVWAPAWVTWRVSGDHCGWAPLPPRAYFDARSGYRYNGVSVGVSFDFGLHADLFTFVSLTDFRQRDLGHHRLPPAQVKNVYNHTTIVNNYVVNNNTIVNKGVSVERVAAVTHTEVKKVTIRDTPASADGRVRPPARGEAVVYRPQLKAPTKPAPMVAQKLDARHPYVQHKEAPIVKAQQKAGITPSPFAPAASNPRNNDKRIENSNIRRPQNTQPAAPNAPNAVTPNVRQPNSSTAAPLTPGGRQQPVTSGSPLSPAPAPGRRDEINQPNHSTDSIKTDNAPLPPAQNSATPKPPITPAVRPQNPNQNSRFYYPKGYNSPAAKRSVPPSNASQSQAPRSSNQQDNKDHDRNGPK
jgi:hypothetical protein